VSEELRAIDGNGFTPDPEPDGNPEANPKQTVSKLLCPYDHDQPALRCAWYEGYLCAVGLVAAHGQGQLDAILERERPAA
jgi:hypothetical protein